MKTVGEQIQLIKRGVERLIDEQELATKISKSILQDKPLIIKLASIFLAKSINNPS